MVLAAVRDYGPRGRIKPMFSDVKSRGFALEEVQLRYAERADQRVMLMT